MIIGRNVVVVRVFVPILFLALSLGFVGLNADQLKPIFQNSELVKDMALRETVINYYSAESAKEWKTTYACRSEDFQRFVSFDRYKNAMEEGMTGWKLLKLKIVDVDTQGANVIIRIRFSEQFDSEVAKSYFDGRVSQGIHRRMEDTVWGKHDNRWKCIDVGQRGHLPMNGALVE